MLITASFWSLLSFLSHSEEFWKKLEFQKQIFYGRLARKSVLIQSLRITSKTEVQALLQQTLQDAGLCSKGGRSRISSGLCGLSNGSGKPVIGIMRRNLQRRELNRETIFQKSTSIHFAWSVMKARGRFMHTWPHLIWNSNLLRQGSL